MKVSEHAFAPQMLYAAERAPTAYWVGRRWAPESVCTLEKREKLCLCWELKNKLPYCA